MATAACERSVRYVSFLAHVLHLPSGRVVDGLEIVDAGCTGMATEVHSAGRKADGKLGEPDGPLPLIGPDGDVDEYGGGQTWRQSESQVVNGVPDAEVTIVTILGGGVAEGYGLS